jgi:hypothetical protein
MGEWIVVKSYPGSTLQPFAHELLYFDSLPGGNNNFYHSQFQLRISSRGLPSMFTPNDDWCVDDIYLGMAGPLVTLSADSLMFDSTLVGESTERELWLVNIGLDSLHIEEIASSNSVFVPDTQQYVLGVGDSLELIIRFTPLQGGSQSGWLRLVSDNISQDTLRVYLSGEGIALTGIAEEAGLPRTYGLSQNFPNPFNPTTVIHYDIPRDGQVKLEVYNLLGQRVRALVDGWSKAGRFDISWDGRNEYGEAVGSGIYLYRFTAGEYQRTLKMILLK